MREAHFMKIFDMDSATAITRCLIWSARAESSHNLLTYHYSWLFTSFTERTIILLKLMNIQSGYGSMNRQ